MNNWFKSGSAWVWMTAGAVSISLVSVLGLLLLIAWRGLIFFWPTDISEFEILQNGKTTTIIGEIYESEQVPVSRLKLNNVVLPPNLQQESLSRYLIKTGNREFVDLDFRWLLETEIKSSDKPTGIAKFERRKNGNFYGYVEQVVEDGNPITDEHRIAKLEQLIARAIELKGKVSAIQNNQISAINYQLEKLRLKEKSLRLKNDLNDENLAELNLQRQQLHHQYSELAAELAELNSAANRDQVVVKDMRGMLVTLPLEQILEVQFPNDMSVFSKLATFAVKVGKFITDEPREANTEGGLFPAIFGTVLMVLLMAVVVAPFGVVAAIYLHEYAAKNAFTRLIRIAVINLAGVPSIVYGVFGLGFFVYLLGGSIDQLFYPESAPNPVFGTPGIIWSALTLAILTLPIVIVSTEEGLARIPSTIRQGSLALGATKAETLWRIIIPMASPAIMTGLILAVARAAGEVAPLMLVGVVKMAPSLPLDGNFPFLHLDRKFMHLGFHIYDVGFQSPNVEAARPLVYATAFILVTVIVSLNITAVGIRNHLREKYKSFEH